jgi:hypothetical protein
MRVIRALLQAFAWLFNLSLGLGLLILSLLAIINGQHNLRLPVVPLQDSTLSYTLLGASLYALLAVFLALQKGRWGRLPMLVWNLAIPLLMLSALLRAGFSFRGPGDAANHLYFFLAALAGLWGSWLHFRRAGQGAARKW